MQRIAIFLSNHGTIGDTDEANGTYASELTHALGEFIKAGFDYDLISIHGGSAPLYGQDEAQDDTHISVLQDDSFLAKLDNTKTFEEIDIATYDAVFYPGGFGLLSDLAHNADVAALTAALYERGGVVGAVCHGPAGLLPVTLSNGDKLLAGKSVTCFTHEEEIAAGTIEKIPFLLEQSVTMSAAKFSKKQPWSEHLVEDQRVVTGQNPASAHAVGKRMVELLS